MVRQAPHAPLQAHRARPSDNSFAPAEGAPTRGLTKGLKIVYPDRADIEVDEHASAYQIPAEEDAMASAGRGARGWKSAELHDDSRILLHRGSADLS